MKWAVVILALGLVSCSPRLSSNSVQGDYTYAGGVPGERLTLGPDGRYEHVWRNGARQEHGSWRLKRETYDDCDAVELRDFTVTNGGHVDRKGDILSACISRNLFGRHDITISSDEGIYLSK